MRNNRSFGSILKDNAVTIMFVALCVIGLAYSGQSISFVLSELFTRLSRNAFIVMALIIPIIAGMGVNFSITIGAMAAQIAMLWVVEWGVQGIGGFTLAALMTLPIAALFGYLIGKLLNKMKGQEMIGGMILGYFANGVYQLLFLFIFGNLIPLTRNGLVIKGSSGVANTIDLSRTGKMKYALDNLWKTQFEPALYVALGVIALLLIVAFVIKFTGAKRQGYKLKRGSLSKLAIQLGMLVAIGLLYQIPQIQMHFVKVQVPMITFAVVGLLCIFNVAIMRTRMGQQFRAVGQNMTVANASGINVDGVRVIAIMISTVLAGWGQLIFVQNMGSFQTYGAHVQVGLYAGAAILVGGASIVRATNAQALLGCILFHTLFTVAPAAGKNLFGDGNIGEYFRVFVSYGVIALALVMHAWSDMQKRKPRNAIREAEHPAH